MRGLTFCVDEHQREFIEDYRQSQGMYSLGDACRELLYLGQLSVAAQNE